LKYEIGRKSRGWRVRKLIEEERNDYWGGIKKIDFIIPLLSKQYFPFFLNKYGNEKDEKEFDRKPKRLGHVVVKKNPRNFIFVG
jgi:hypothetical protein